MKIAQVRVQKWIQDEGLQDEVKMLLTVHDELVFEIRWGSNFFELTSQVAAKMCPPLEQYRWDVPVETDVEVGENWAEMMDFNDLMKHLSSGLGCSQVVLDHHTHFHTHSPVKTTRSNLKD